MNDKRHGVGAAIRRESYAADDKLDGDAVRIVLLSRCRKQQYWRLKPWNLLLISLFLIALPPQPSYKQRLIVFSIVNIKCQHIVSPEPTFQSKPWNTPFLLTKAAKVVSEVIRTIKWPMVLETVGPNLWGRSSRLVASTFWRWIGKRKQIGTLSAVGQR